MDDRKDRNHGVQRESAPRRLLILEDEEAILRPMARYFTTLGWEVVAAREPEEAEALFEHSRFDLVVLDLGLTSFGREGLSVLGSLRARDPHLPVVVLSGYLSPEVEAEARRLGADAILQKPYPLLGLAQVIEGLAGPAED
jgi:DNA-binding response OmpR family regulator